MGSLGDLLEQRASATFVGRLEERASLLQLLEPDGPLVAFVHGIAGVGKSTLLDAFTRDAREHGATVVRLDCRSIEPTEAGFLAALAAAVGGVRGTPAAAASRLADLGERVMLVLDTYELLRLLDPWLRQELIPVLPDGVRVLIAGREPPVRAWLTSPGWSELVRTLRLGSLEAVEANELLTRAGVGNAQARRLNRIARGHPLSLRIAASAARDNPSLELEHAASSGVLQALTELYLAGVDPATRRVLDAASVVRRVTLPLLAAMLPDVAPQDAFDRLRELPFVDHGPDGLVVHDTIREATAAALRAADPASFAAYRAAAWRRLRADLRGAVPDQLWRTTADTLYLIENPVVREAFFPSTEHLYFVESARSEDAAAISSITDRHEPPAAAALLRTWWERIPERFSVIRGPDGEVAGFFLMFEPNHVAHAWLEADPVTRRWREHLRRERVPAGQRVLFFRRFLSLEHGEAPSPVQAAAWLDVKRIYMELRPSLRRLYCTLVDVEPYAPAIQGLGFVPLPEAGIEIDGVPYGSALLDFGPGSVDGWLSWLVESELSGEELLFLDREQRQLVIAGRRIDLSRLEYGVLECLREREGAVLSREELLLHVWGTEYTGGSNVVEAVVRTLRRKLGEHAALVETVRGVGYRLVEPDVPSSAPPPPSSGTTLTT